MNKLPTMSCGVPGWRYGENSHISMPLTSEPFYVNILENIVLPSLIMSDSRKRKMSMIEGSDRHPCDLDISLASVGNTYNDMNCVTISDDMKLVVSGFGDSSLRLHNFDTSRKFFSTDMNYVLPASTTTVVPDYATYTSPYLTLQGHSKPVFGVALDANSRIILSSAGDETIRLWDIELQQCVARINTSTEGICWGLEFSPCDYYYAAAMQHNVAALYCTDRLIKIRVFSGHSDDVTVATWHPNMQYVLTGSADGTARAYDIRTAESLRVFKTPTNSSITCAVVSPCGRYIAVGCDDGVILLFEITMNRLIATLRGHSNTVYSIAFNSTTTVVTSGSEDQSVIVWDISKVNSDCDLVVVAPHYTFPTKNTPVYCVNFHSDSLLAAVGPLGSDVPVTTGSVEKM